MQNFGVLMWKPQLVLIMWQVFTLELNIHSNFLTGIYFLRATAQTLNEPSQSPPSQTFCNIHTQPETSPTEHFSTQGVRCFRYSSVICLALYKDMPIPTMAIVMAMGSTPLLCGRICTSPETCLCGQNGLHASCSLLHHQGQSTLYNLCMNNLLIASSSSKVKRKMSPKQLQFDLFLSASL